MKNTVRLFLYLIIQNIFVENLFYENFMSIVEFFCEHLTAENLSKICFKISKIIFYRLMCYTRNHASTITHFKINLKKNKYL